MKLTLARSAWLAAVAALATLASAATGFGATYTWTAGGSNNDWFTSIGGLALTSNWNSPGTTFVTNDSLVFGTAGAAKTSPNQNTSVTVQNVTFEAGAPQYTLSSAFFSTLTVNGSITNNSSNQQLFGSQQIAMQNGSVIDTGAAGISFTSLFGGAGSFTKQGSGTLAVNSMSTYTGTMTVAAGTVNDTSPTFAGSVNNTGGTFTGAIVQGNVISSATTSVTTQVGGDVTVNGGVFLSNFVSGQYTQTAGSGTVGTLNDFSSLSGGTLKANLIVQNFTQTGGVLTGTGGPNGDATFLSEAFTISGGTANINGAKTVNQTGGEIVFSPGAVTQSATFGGVNSITGTVGSQVSVGGGLTLLAGNSTTLDFTNTGVSDRFTITGGALDYGGTLNLNMTTSGTAANNTTWQLFQPTAGTSGSFASLSPITSAETSYSGLTWGLAANSTNYFDQQYGPGVWLSDWSTSGQRFIFNQSSGVLTVVPEPSTMVFAGIGAAMLGWQTWAGRRRKARMKLIDEHTRRLSEERGLA